MAFLTKLRNKFEVLQQQADTELFWRSIARQVTPATIQEMPEYVWIDRKYMVRCLIVGVPPSSDISGYPADLNQKVIDELLSISTEGHRIGLSYLVKPIPNVEAMKMLDEALFNNRVSQDSYRDKSDKKDKTKQPPLKKVFEEEEFVQNYKEVYSNKQKLFHTAFIVLLWGRDREALREAESHVTIILESNRIYYEVPDYRHLTTLLAAQPYPQWVDYSWIELFSYHTAALLPTRNPNSRCDDVGLFFGNDLLTGKNIMIDLKTLAAQHLMFTGSTGSGKTFTLLILLMRAHDLLDKRVILIEPKADSTTAYRKVVEYYGGTVIDLGIAGTKTVNPLQIIFDPQMGDSKLEYQRAFDAHTRLVNQFFQTLFEGSGTINTANYINETLIECYRRKGIYRDDPKSWQGKKWPTLADDLRPIWIEDAKDVKNVTAKACVDKTYMANTAWAYLSKGDTDIDLSSDFIVVDTSDVPDDLKDATTVLITGIMGMRFKADSKRETIIACDEAGAVLRNPKLALFLLQTLTQGRSFNIGLWLCTQQPSDLVKNGVSEEFKTNIFINIVLGNNMKADSIQIVKDYYRLSDMDCSNLQACGVGEGLLLVGSEVIPTSFKPTPLEMEIIKGRYNSEHVQSGSNTDVALVHEELRSLINDYEIYIPYWLQDSQNFSNFSVPTGYKGYRAWHLDGRRIQVWLPSAKVTGNEIENQSIDHYATLLQLAGWAVMNHIPIMELNVTSQAGGADVVLMVNTVKYALEYEHPGSHCFSELVAKKEAIERTGAVPLFICQQSNYEDMVRAVGEKCVVQRGSELVNKLEELKALKVRIGE